ncbi:chemotaxis protein CheB [Bosea sp. WAO]|uniref:chemotaxis protein CheB n=1 Tax=Bosea sp. WAO TaxID=406341 RepID=UPI000746ECEE|nr:chemotaxis protein CheB [Bosea sp. WAO]KUL97322.1 chemotaxis protein CheB [Bosea sp. WAO]
MSSLEAQAIVIGASAGALEALSAILPVLPKGFGLPIMIVVHVPPDRDSVLSELFQAKCGLLVKEAEDKEPILGGTVYFAPPGYHLLIEADKCLALSSDEPVLFSRPSIDVLFESAADAYGSGLIGVVLTGANQDGAKGLQAIVEAGGTALVQSPKGAFSSVMPEAAIKSVPTAIVMPPEQIATCLQNIRVRA